MFKVRVNMNILKLIKFGFARKIPNDPSRFSFKIERFKPTESKYTINSNEQVTLEGTDPETHIPAYLQKDKANQEDNNFSRIKNNIVPRHLKPGKKLILPHKKVQFKPNKEERAKMRKEQREIQLKLDEEKFKLNNENSVDRNDQKYIAKQRELITRQLKTIKRDTMLERRRIFNTENLIDFKTPERLSKRLARLGVTSRRQADKLIELGMIKIDGKTVNENTLVDDTSSIQVYGKNGYKTPIPQNAKIWLFHKPAGLVSTYKDPQNRPTIYSYLNHIKFDLKHYLIIVIFYNLG
jgi:hypothetical protein